MTKRHFRMVFFIAILFVFRQTALQGQTLPLASVIKAQAVDMGRAMVNRDVEKFGAYMHPVLVEKAGGPEKMRAMADTMNKVFIQFGAMVTKIIFGNPAAVVEFRKTMQTTLPQTTFLTTLMGDVEITTTLVAISMDQGKRWYFIDTAVFGEATLRKDLPELSKELVIPPPSKPRITPKEQ